MMIMVADGIEHGAKLAVETGIFGKTYTYKKDGDAKEATDNKELKRNTVVYPSIAVQWLNFITYLILLIVYVPGDKGHLTAFYFVIAVSGFVFGLSNVLTFAIDDNYLPIYIAGENCFPATTSLIHYLSTLMFGNRRKWNSDFLMVYIDLVVAILLSLLSAVLWTLGYVSKHPTEEDALKPKATEVVTKIIEGLNGKINSSAEVVEAIVKHLESKIEEAGTKIEAIQEVKLAIDQAIQSAIQSAQARSGTATVKAVVQSVLEALKAQATQITEALTPLDITNADKDISDAISTTLPKLTNLNQTYDPKKHDATTILKEALAVVAKVKDEHLDTPINEVLNKVNLQGQAGQVKNKLQQGPNLGITADTTSISQALHNLQENGKPKPEAIAAVKQALEATNITDTDLDTPIGTVLTTKNGLQGKIQAVKTNLKSGGGGQTNINIGADTITLALGKLQQEGQPNATAIADVQSALSQGTEKDPYIQLWHINPPGGYQGEIVDPKTFMPFLMVLVGMGLVYCIYPAIAPGMIVPFYLVDKIEMVLLIATIFPPLIVAIVTKYKFGWSPKAAWTDNSKDFFPGSPCNYMWHFFDLVIPTMIILAYLFIYSLHYRDSSVARSIINQPKMSTCLTILFYMCHEISLAVGFPGIFGGNGGGSILALTAQLIGAFLMCLLAPYSEGYIIEYKRHDPSNWPTAGMTRWNALRYWTKQASKNCNKNLAALFTKDLRRDLLLCIERNELI
ncbi:Tpr family protein [Theileria parva strain Muguga]|uniref:Uncharacterized protein n=1 Tax=Theileria parva TaxID=5875 RepID=Q4MYC5_THEPA|nr:uncharacterized protein TpMuguga_03g00926 [Theileria parva strain Muguga]EAN30434.1 Tpr family protein [Theileria parva strain Muguga]|eukprot:XP_762717.1 hypothetical protein [Theileria parva strain Muguga]